MSTIDHKANQRAEIEDLLPWHASGTLKRRDAERVEKALQADGELARRLALVHEEMSATILSNETLGAPSARAAEKLFAAIDAEPARQRAVARDPIGWIAGFITALSPRTLAWSASAAALAIVSQAAVLTGVLVSEQRGVSYSVASVDVADTDDTYVLVRFVPGATARDITAFLDRHRAVLLEPKPGGLFRVGLALTGATKEARAAAVKSMQADTKVVGFVVASE